MFNRTIHLLGPPAGRLCVLLSGNRVRSALLREPHVSELPGGWQLGMFFCGGGEGHSAEGSWEDPRPGAACCELSGTSVLEKNACGHTASGYRFPWKALWSPRRTHSQVKSSNTHRRGESVYGWEGNTWNLPWEDRQGAFFYLEEMERGQDLSLETSRGGAGRGGQ